MTALAITSAVLLTFRLYAASRVGFGDSEALYASYAAHPQPAYLDHPGLVGMVMRAVGDLPAAPSRVHLVTSFAATAVPWILFATARALGAPKERAALAALATALAPEIAVGLFGMTPDLLLAPLWLGAIALAAVGLSSDRASSRSAAALVGAGLLAGVAVAAKVSGVLLFAALAVTYASTRRRAEAARGPWPWAGLAVGLVVVLPIALYEARSGWPMLRHRLVDTQHGAGGALGHVGALASGQLAYVSPVLLWIGARTAIDLVHKRGEDALSRLLFLVFAIPIVPLLLLSVWSPVAEPHWIAPALLALPLHAARSDAPLAPRRLFLTGASIAGALTLGAHLWVLVPSSPRLLPAGVDPKVDIARELFGWPRAIEAVREAQRALATPFDPEGREVVLVGPHWTVCAQLQAALPAAAVGCATPIRDDFDDWLPRALWRHADRVLWITDDRFPDDGRAALHEHAAVASARVSVLRGGRVARVFHITTYDRRASGELRRAPAERHSAASSRAATFGGIASSPATRSSSMSSASPWFGVVSSLSP